MSALPPDLGGNGDADHPEHEERRTWVGRRFDPEAFDRAEINRKLRLLR